MCFVKMCEKVRIYNIKKQREYILINFLIDSTMTC